MTAYQLRLPSFEGPLDLLLQLIERRQLDITTVSLALVTDQYMEHLRTGAGIDSDQLSEFVAVAAKLLLIKSMALLPRPPQIKPEEPPPDPTDLTERLREYEAIKHAALTLKSREEANLRSYPQLFSAAAQVALRIGQNGPARDGDASANGGRVATRGPAVASQLRLFAEEDRDDGPAGPRPSPRGLVTAFRRATGRRPREEEPVEIARDTWTVAEAVRWLVGTALRNGAVSFGRIVAGLNRTRLVTAFLAVLELHRQGRLCARQDGPHADLVLAVPEFGDDGETEAHA